MVRPGQGNASAILILLGATLAGCAGTAPSETLGSDAHHLSPTGQAAVAVVGTIEGGFNPYHELFASETASPPSSMLDATTGMLPVPIRLTREGTFEERLAQDEDVLAAMQPGTLYWFEGTRVLGISLDSSRPVSLVQGSGHGNSVASTIRAVSPEAWIVIVQDPPFLNLGDGFNSDFYEAMAEGMEWLAAQPWVDVISLSKGHPGNPPLDWSPLPQMARLAAQRGKVLVSGGGNDPTVSFLEGASGPPWFISVGGAEGSTRGETVASSKFVDVVADYTRRVADQEPDEYRSSHGTSFSAPAVAANIAQALFELRRSEEGGSRDEGVLCTCAGGQVRASDLREALNASATYWTASDWEPQNSTAEDPLDLALHATAPVAAAPWVQMGWGYVGDQAWRTLADFLLEGSVSEKPKAAREHMAAYQAAREAYWSMTG